jgi:hypothetical protein
LKSDDKWVFREITHALGSSILDSKKCIQHLRNMLKVDDQLHKQMRKDLTAKERQVNFLIEDNAKIAHELQNLKKQCGASDERN